MSETPATHHLIVVGVDDSANSHRALAWAAQEAVRRGATLQVITAWSWDALEGAPLVGVDPATLQVAAEQTQQLAYEAVVEPMDPRPVLARTVVQGLAADVIAEASRTADLVVMGTHGRGPVRAFLLGSVSQGVIKRSACPVVVIPPVHEEPDRHEEVAVAAGHADRPRPATTPPVRHAE